MAIFSGDFANRLLEVAKKVSPTEGIAKYFEDIKTAREQAPIIEKLSAELQRESSSASEAAKRLLKKESELNSELVKSVAERLDKKLERAKNNITSSLQKPQPTNLEFLNQAIDAKRGGNTEKPVTTLELLRDKLVAINQETEALLKKVANTENPTKVTGLAIEAAGILRLYDDVSTMLRTNESGIIFKDTDSRVRHSLIASLDEKELAQLIDYLNTLDTQRQGLANIAGKNKKSTPIPYYMLEVTPEASTTIVKKQGDFYGDITYKEKVTGGKWKEKTLMGKDGKPIAGLTRAEIMDAIARAEAKLRVELGDPNYKIKVTEDKDGTIHYDTGNAHNRNVLHEEFKAAYDHKVDAAASKAATTVSHVPPTPTKGATVQHTTAQPENSNPQPGNANGLNQQQ